MILSDRDLSQIDADYLDTLPETRLRTLSKDLLADLKTARERLNQSPATSSRPPSSQAPWTTSEPEQPQSDDDLPPADESAADTTPSDDSEKTESSESPTPPTDDTPPDTTQKPGRQPGSAGHSRELTLPVTRTVEHAPECCAGCGQLFNESHKRLLWNARYELDLEPGSEDRPALQIQHTRYEYWVISCDCGHQTHAEPGRCLDDPEWSVAVSEWHLCGPHLVSFLVFMALSMRASRRRIQDFLHTWLGIDLSTSTINQCIHEAARAVEPVVDEQLVPELNASALLHIDETPWKESGKLLWLWVFVGSYTVVYKIGKRHRLVVQQLLGDIFNGFLMTDGFSVYRIFPKRLRCWAHLIRKARALHQCLDSQGQAFGEALLLGMIILMRNIYRLREDPDDPDALKAQNQQLLVWIHTLCEIQQTLAHEDSRKLAVEFLNDWDAIMRVVETPAHPLTNNVAERILRNWVLLRKITFGSRTAQGSRVIALLASVIDTARLREVNPWDFIAQVLAARRKNLPAPAMPMCALA